MPLIKEGRIIFSANRISFRFTEKEGVMESKDAVGVILVGLGVLLLLASAFDLVPNLDNVLIFLGLACFIAAGVIKKITKGGCCK
ncbi:MAG: hypothetical protein A2Z72_03060 [Omnitrophica bacterium RBG_13_46_9]|nr:MAG: hypothetical protein A2Z72_03060 [Omnitrophica bacterium RBG_13_46_9]